METKNFITDSGEIISLDDFLEAIQHFGIEVGTYDARAVAGFISDVMEELMTYQDSKLNIDSHYKNILIRIKLNLIDYTDDEDE